MRSLFRFLPAKLKAYVQYATASPAGEKKSHALAAELAEWRASPAFSSDCERLAHYPLHSLLSAQSRALLHHLITTRKPSHVLEIGTYMAGTAEVLAGALADTASGHLDTIDPYGGERCPPIIAQWPQRLRDRVTFHPIDSGMFFDGAITQRRFFDLVFIDGNHEYEYAYFDIQCAARIMNPGGVMMLDNIEQPGPKFATISFLKANPDWIDVGGKIGKCDPAQPLAMPEPSFPDTNCFLLQAPSYWTVGTVPRSFGSLPSPAGEIHSVSLKLAASVKGTIHVQVYFRAFTAIPQEACVRCTQRLSTHDAREISFPLPERIAIPPQPDVDIRSEVILAFIPDKSGNVLRLSEPPEINLI